jgi:hypothetical protein
MPTDIPHLRNAVLNEDRSLAEVGYSARIQKKTTALNRVND